MARASSFSTTVKAAGDRVVSGPHFDQTRSEPEITSPNPARARHLVAKPDLAQKPNLASESRCAQLRGIKKRSVRV